MDGYQVLTLLKQDERTADIPVIVITGSLTDEQVKQRKVLALGAPSGQAFRDRRLGRRDPPVYG
jgi:CheY-like chemotaxis protein